MKVAIYIRTSKKDQVLENQLIPLEKYVQSLGWAYEVFHEQETTRKTRPIQWGLYNRLLKKEFDGLIIYKFDRWARSTRELITHMEELQNKKVRFISYTENVDLGTPSGMLMFTMISAFAQFERDMISERTMAGLDRARAQGKTLGRPKKKRGYVKQG